MGKKYDKPKAGDWIEPRRRKGYKLACCDCGLVHVVNFRIVNPKWKKIQFQVFRDNRATAAMRREDKKRAERV